MISSSEIKEIVKSYKERCEDPEYIKYRKEQAVQVRKLEKELLQSKCLHNLYPEDINRFYTSIDSEKITEYTEYSNYDVGLMDICLSGCSKLYLSTFPGSLENNERLLEWIRNVRYAVSTSSSVKELTQMISDLRKDFYGMDTLTIKAPRLDPDDSGKISEERLDCLTHEAFVGMFGLNPLRRKGIPNFIYVYGAFESSPPIIHTDSRKILAWGTSEIVSDQITYTVLENLTHRETLNESCKYDTYDVILGFFLQVLLALKVANETCQFTHYNLHNKNVLLKRVSNSTMDIEYPLGDKKIWIRSERGMVATIQEFSTSYIFVNVDNAPQGFGYNNYDDVPFDSVGIYSTKNFVIGDAYKLMMHILGTTFLENKTAYNQLKPLFSFFSSESVEDALVSQKDTFLHLPLCEKTQKLELTDFINYILKKYETSGVFFRTYSPTKFGSFLLRTSGTLFDKSDIQKDLETKTSLLCVPKNTIQLYDYIKYYAILYSETKDKINIDLINKAAELFEREFTEEVNRVENDRLDSIGSTLSSRFILQEISYNKNFLKRPEVKELFKAFLSKSILYMNAWERMKTGLKILEFIEKGGSMFKTLYESYNELQTKNKVFYEAVRFNLLRFYTFFTTYNLQNESYSSILQGITKEKHLETIREMNKDPEFHWYFLSANFLKSFW